MLSSLFPFKSENKIDISRRETEAHIKKVRQNLSIFSDNLSQRAVVHDKSKLNSPEVEVFAEYGPKLKKTTYMSDEYKENLKAMEPALIHHYTNNDHHPEFYSNGVDGMNLMALVEMFCDWKAATERHADGDLRTSISNNAERFNLSPQLVSILLNTVDALEKSNK